MKVIKTVMAGSVAMALVSFSANAANPGGQGEVVFKGTVVNAPCGIAAGNEGAAVEVDFGQVSKEKLEDSFEQKDFSIKLTNCDTEHLTNGVSLTFGGATTQSTELPTAGGTGTAIVLSGYGKDITFGTATDYIQLVDGDNELAFSAKLKKANGEAISEGAFNATSTFSLNYQ
ncbi:fimbrial protein [Escherichia coli]|uniref:fimbrial protein n=1 Tax=Escherichia coli TaxID=562 RepID=UPI0010D09457|nr:fimbrial protein [Escherichia coli]GDM19331.1 major pilin protein PapA [Escherichia coli]